MNIVQTVKGSCLECFSYTGFYFFTLYGALIFVISLFNLRDIERKSIKNQQSYPMTIGEIGVIDRQIGPSSVTQLFGLILDIFKIDKFYLLLEWIIRLMRMIFGISDSRFNPIKVFLRMFYFYLAVIPLPAAFLPPVYHKQSAPDFHLLIATLLLIVTNAAGDTISSKITVHNFTKGLLSGKNALKKLGVSSDNKTTFWKEEVLHLKILGVMLKDLSLALLVLIFVLGFSSVLFGVQIAEYKFSTDPIVISQMINRFFRFYELTKELYWFRGGDPGPFGYPGIPAMFMYGVSTFLPTIFIFSATLVWFFVLPFRILVQMPKPGLPRTVMAEFSVVGLCTMFNLFKSIDLSKVYGFFITN